MEHLTAHFERQQDLLWRAFIEESPEIHAAGRSLSAAQEQLRSALAIRGHSDSEVRTLIELPDHTRAAVAAAATARSLAVEAANQSAALTAEAAKVLVDDGLSLRDVATVLGLSHTRVQQLLRSPTSATAAGDSDEGRHAGSAGNARHPSR